jgi:hypothetical protein
MMPLKLIWMAAIAIGFGLASPHPASSEGASKLNITLEQKHVIQELIKDAKIEAADDTKVLSGLSVGDTLPTGLIPVPMPTAIGQKVPHIKAHQLVVSRDMILIVDPKDQQIVATIER